MGDGRPGQRRHRHRHRRPRHRLRAHECGGRHRGHRTAHMAVGVVDAAVVARDLAAVERRVGDVDVGDVGRAGAIRRPIHFARRQREPGDRTLALRIGARADADEGHQRRRIHRACGARARHPSPAVVKARPAAVVRHREAPRRIVDPGPAPRLHVRPVAVAVRRPVAADMRRHPDVAVVRHRAPGALVVQVFVADQVGRHVARRTRLLDAAVARGRPAVEFVVQVGRA